MCASWHQVLAKSIQLNNVVCVCAVFFFFFSGLILRTLWCKFWALKGKSVEKEKIERMSEGVRAEEEKREREKKYEGGMKEREKCFHYSRAV